MSETLEAGERLDQRVAEEVMGWRFNESWNQIVPPEQKARPWEMWRRSEFGFEPVPGAAVPGIVYNGDLSAIRVPQYSTDIAAAWRIVEHYAEWPVEVCKTWSRDGELVGWEASIAGIQAYAKTPCLAICGAALNLEQTRRELASGKLERVAGE